jgi:hypothetical protein
MMPAKLVVLVVVVSIKRVLQAGPSLPPALRFSGCFHYPSRSAHLLEDAATRWGWKCANTSYGEECPRSFLHFLNTRESTDGLHFGQLIAVRLYDRLRGSISTRPRAAKTPNISTKRLSALVPRNSQASKCECIRASSLISIKYGAPGWLPLAHQSCSLETCYSLILLFSLAQKHRQRRDHSDMHIPFYNTYGALFVIWHPPPSTQADTRGLVVVEDTYLTPSTGH